MLVHLVHEIVKILNLHTQVGHVIAGNLKIIPDSRISNIVSKGPKYRFPSKSISIDEGKKLHLL